MPSRYRSPTLRPTAWITPLTSCPNSKGFCASTFRYPCVCMRTSVPHTEALPTLSRISPSPISGTGTSLTLRSILPYKKAAFICFIVNLQCCYLLPKLFQCDRPPLQDRPVAGIDRLHGHHPVDTCRNRLPIVQDA